MAYTTKAKVETLLGGITIPAGFDIATIIGWIQKFIDNYVGSTFEAATQTWYYDGNGKHELTIENFTSITSVDILNLDGSVMLSLTQNTDFIVGPFNSNIKFFLRMMPTGKMTHFPRRSRSVKVVGLFGVTTAVPADIEMAATMLAAEIYQFKTQRGKLARVRLGDYEEMYNQITQGDDLMGVKQILDNYRTPEL